MWHDDGVDVEGEVTTPWAIHATIIFKSKPLPWMLTSLYANPRNMKKKEAFAKVTYLGPNCNFSYIVVGDFNALAFPEDKQGGKLPTLSQLQDFGEVMELCNMTELSGSGGDFT